VSTAATSDLILVDTVVTDRREEKRREEKGIEVLMSVLTREPRPQQRSSLECRNEPMTFVNTRKDIPMAQTDTERDVKRDNWLRHHQPEGASDYPEIPKRSYREEVFLDLSLGGIALLLLFLIWIASRVGLALAG
jgi:hypothetical protein